AAAVCVCLLHANEFGKRRDAECAALAGERCFARLALLCGVRAAPFLPVPGFARTVPAAVALGCFSPEPGRSLKAFASIAGCQFLARIVLVHSMNSEQPLAARAVVLIQECGEPGQEFLFHGWIEHIAGPGEFEQGEAALALSGLHQGC